MVLGRKFVHLKMNTFAKAGRIALSHLFRKKKEVFPTNRYEEMGMMKVLPREVFTSDEPIELEKEYLAHVVGALGREKDYKIFFWSVETGLTEILLVSSENEGKLSDLICRFTEGPITHVIVAQKRMYDADEECYEVDDGNYNDDSFILVQEKIIIYSLTEKQKQYISNRIHNEQLDQFESVEEFTFYHGYFPEKGIVGGKR